MVRPNAFTVNMDLEIMEDHKNGVEISTTARKLRMSKRSIEHRIVKLKAAAGEEVRSLARQENVKPSSDELTNAKERKCLMHSGPFLSMHSGERICPRCRASRAWRSGQSDFSEVVG